MRKTFSIQYNNVSRQIVQVIIVHARLYRPSCRPYIGTALRLSFYMDKRTPAVHGQDRDVLDSYLSTAMQPMSFAVGTFNEYSTHFRL